MSRLQSRGSVTSPKNKKIDNFNVKRPEEDGMKKFNQNLVQKKRFGSFMKGTFGVMDVG